MSTDNAWMPLYVGDYLADTMHLAGPEHGAYLLLLMHQWRTGPLPDDDRKLAAIARTERRDWAEMASTIREFFEVTEGGLVQARLERIRAQQGVKIEKRRAAGRASAEAKKRQQNENEKAQSAEHAPNGKPTHVQHVLNGCSPPVEGLLASSLTELELEPEEREEPLLRNGPPAGPAPGVGPAELAPDARTALFREGLARLGRLTGKPPKACRAVIGRLLRDAGDDAALVGMVLTEAEAARPADPMAWIGASLAARTGSRGAGKPRSATSQWAALMQGDAPAGFDVDGTAEEVAH